MRNSAFRILLASSALALAGCAGEGSRSGFFDGLDLDLRGSAGTLDTSEAARNASVVKPQPDERGVVSYPGYQVVMARRGDTVQTVAARIGIPAGELARHNTLPDTVVLREGEILALPRRVPEPAGLPGGSGVDVVTIAGNAIENARQTPGLPSGEEPSRHRVRPGETAFSIARTYDIPVAELAFASLLAATLLAAPFVGGALFLLVATCPSGAQGKIGEKIVERGLFFV